MPDQKEPVPTTPTTKTAAAFFDVDNTMMVGASMFHFARGLAARKFFSPRDLLTFTLMQAKYRIAGRENPDDMSHTRESALAFVAGKSVAELVGLGAEIYDDTMARRIWSGTRAIAQAHLDAGEDVWLVTATPLELAQIIADRLGLTGAIGTVAERVDGVYTGHLVGDVLHGEAKATAVRALAIERGYDLSASYAYSDSINDLPLLGTVGHPNVVNPDPALKAAARDRGWASHDFRTGRRAAKIAIPTVAGLGAAAGAAVAGHRIATQRAQLKAEREAIRDAALARTAASARPMNALRAGGKALAGWSRALGR